MHSKGNRVTPTILTGASSGIGARTAELLRDRGHDVIGLARRADEIPAGVERVRADLTDQVSLDPVWSPTAPGTR